MIWTACKITLDQYECSCGFVYHPRECLYTSGSIRRLNIEPYYQYSQNHTGITEKDDGKYFFHHGLFSGIHFM